MGNGMKMFLVAAALLLVVVLATTESSSPDVIQAVPAGSIPTQAAATQPSPPPATAAPVAGAEEAIAAVRRMLPAGMNPSPIRVGALEGGVGVLAGGDGAFWVSGGQVCAANGTAKTWVPRLPYCRTGIDLYSVQAVAK